MSFLGTWRSTRHLVPQESWCVFEPVCRCAWKFKALEAQRRCHSQKGRQVWSKSEGKSTDCIIRRSRKRASKPCRENRPGLVLCWFHSVARESKSKAAKTSCAVTLCCVVSKMERISRFSCRRVFSTIIISRPECTNKNKRSASQDRNTDNQRAATHHSIIKKVCYNKTERSSLLNDRVHVKELKQKRWIKCLTRLYFSIKRSGDKTQIKMETQEQNQLKENPRRN